MCFRISERARPWKQRYVWKVLELKKGGVLGGPYYAGLEWQPGMVKAKGNEWWSSRDVVSGVARHGIYVFKTEAEARREQRRWDCVVIVKLRVDPKDFLYTDGKAQATYKKVRLLEKQDEIEFY